MDQVLQVVVAADGSLREHFVDVQLHRLKRGGGVVLLLFLFWFCLVAVMKRRIVVGLRTIRSQK